MSEHDEPIAWGWLHKDGVIYDCITPGEHDRVQGEYTTPLYTRPAQWVGLTDEEIYARCNAFYRWSEWDEYMEDWLELGRAIEAALKEKNT